MPALLVAALLTHHLAAAPRPAAAPSPGAQPRLAQAEPPDAGPADRGWPPVPDPRRAIARATAGEPPISAVQAAAARQVEEAAPDPAALAARRRVAALLPRLTAQWSAEARSYRVVGLQGSSEVDYARSSPGTTLEVRATWELPDLVVTRGEPSATSAALSRARRREEVVRRATSLYFERRRLLVLLALEPPPSPLARAEVELELDRTTAELDALTGGVFERWSGR